MRIAVYGGSFNPPHLAHEMVAKWVLNSGSAEAVWLVPVYRHAFETTHSKVLAPFEQRLRWCQAMAEGIGEGVEASPVESTLPTPSFTIDTLSHLAAAYPQHDFRLVIGADILEQVDGWKDWDTIMADFSPIVVGRDGYPSPNGVPVFPAVSSTEIRDRLARREDASELVCPDVWELLKLEHPWGH